MGSPNAINVRKYTVDDPADLGLLLSNVVDDFSPLTVPNFGTLAQRNTAAGQVAFMECWVAGVKYQRRGPNWVQVGGAGWGGGELSSAVAFGVPTSAPGDPKWTVVNFPTTGGTFDGDTDAFYASSAANGIVVPPGRYWVKGYLKWTASSSGGRRLCGIAASSVGVSGPSTRTRDGSPNWPSTIDPEVTCEGEVTMGTAGTLALLAYQDAGGPITVTDRILEFRRVA